MQKDAPAAAALLANGEDRDAANGDVCTEKVLPFEMGFDDSYGVDAAVSLHSSTATSGDHTGLIDTELNPMTRHTTAVPSAQAEASRVCLATAPTTAQPTPPFQLAQLRRPSPPPPPPRSCSGGATPSSSPPLKPQGRSGRQRSSGRRLPSLAPRQGSLTPPPPKKSKAVTSPVVPLQPLSLPSLSSSVASNELTPPVLAVTSTARSPRVVQEEEPDVCCICLEEYNTENPMFRGECRHHFHLSCLLEWKQRSNACPMCCAETLHGVGESTTPMHWKPATEEEQVRQREIAARDQELAERLQRKYLRRAQQQNEQRVFHLRLLQEQQSQSQPPPLPATYMAAPWGRFQQQLAAPTPVNAPTHSPEGVVPHRQPVRVEGVPRENAGGRSRFGRQPKRGGGMRETTAGAAGEAGDRASTPVVYPQLQREERRHRRGGRSGDCCAM